MTTKTIEHTKLIELLGTSTKGYRYWLGADNYVYQQLPANFSPTASNYPNGRANEFNGWICSLETWERTFCKIFLKDTLLCSL